MIRIFSACIVGMAWMTSCFGGSFNEWQETATYEIDYIVDLSSLPGDQVTNLWVPLPVNDRNQEVLSSDSKPLQKDWVRRDITDNRGNKVAEFVLPARKDRADTLHLRYLVKRHPSSGTPISAMGENDDPGSYLSSSSMIPLGGLIASIADEEALKAESPKKLPRTYYDYVYKSMTYSKEGEGWGQGDAIWACESKYGNCTDFHSLYIGLARSKNIPARFKIGFPLSAAESSGRHDGYHCWAEFFDDNKGWIPLDASEAKKQTLPDQYFGRLPSDRVEFTQGRDIILSERQRGEPINYFVYPYAESSSEIVSRLPVKLLYRRLENETAD